MTIEQRHKFGYPIKRLRRRNTSDLMATQAALKCHVTRTISERDRAFPTIRLSHFKFIPIKYGLK